LVLFDLHTRANSVVQNFNLDRSCSTYEGTIEMIVSDVAPIYQRVLNYLPMLS